jgi:uncharacterized SAM-binding protein YcdF (DUF218 family)
MQNASSAFLKVIGDYLLVETPLARADACILFGGAYPACRAEKAAELYHLGYFDLIVSTGGVTVPGTGELESRFMSSVLTALGVPEDRILHEDRAQMTGENLLFSKDLLEPLGARTVLGVGGIHAARRFLMTLERHWPQAAKMFAAANPYGVKPEDWHTHAEFRKDVFAEHAKIAPYKAQGLITEVDMDALKAKILTLPPPAPLRLKPAG